MNGARPAQCIAGSIAGVLLLLGSGCASYRLTPKPVESTRQGFFDQKFTPVNTRTHGKNPSDSVSSRHPSQMAHSTHSARAGKTGTQSDKARVVDPLRSSGTSSSHGFQWPVNSVEVTSIFGKRGKSVHEGIDLHAAIGTPVFASKDGVVLFAGSKIRGYGRMVVLRHHDQIATIYAHNSELLVHRGQFVKQGQQIAVSGATGHVSGPHVHFEIRRGMAALDPLRFLPRVPGRLTASK